LINGILEDVVNSFIDLSDGRIWSSFTDNSDLKERLREKAIRTQRVNIKAAHEVIQNVRKLPIFRIFGDVTIVDTIRDLAFNVRITVEHAVQPPL